MLWEKELAKGATNAVAADEDGNIFLQLSEGTFAGNEKLLMFDSDGNKKWEISIDNFRFFNYPSYYKGKIYSYGQHGSGNDKRSFIYVHDTTGNEKLALEFPITIRSLSVDNNENMYITAYNTGVAEEKTGVFKLDAKGEIIWKLYFQAQSVTPVLISENLTAFLGITNEGPGLFFLDVLNGRVSKALALGNNSSISSSYAVIRGPEILFPKAYEYGYVRVTSTAIERIIPF